MSGRFVERVYYNAYDQPELVLDAHPFDYDDDGDVDAADIAAATTGDATSHSPSSWEETIRRQAASETGRPCNPSGR